ncbi:uncharacterized protein B0I36DRAFT_358387 [Microdochium trichocladiopsis]|uniref:Gfd2/YDR514C-like C-terminal domain-containing protein n=1 Tax=Microdochium trichocladiopsis TaxID=1682393 RepID=A0A9P8YJK5_9PEZI|nr:uncharacterized protein B0I36DRAFT_358387 [Microdochium trichocladiopsis]KAH7041198.1 hypothetical protein B0I36DRAFT_358387 [Microdochium trichocladiopsis]
MADVPQPQASRPRQRYRRRGGQSAQVDDKSSKNPSTNRQSATNNSQAPHNKPPPGAAGARPGRRRGPRNGNVPVQSQPPGPSNNGIDHPQAPEATSGPRAFPIVMGAILPGSNPPVPAQVQQHYPIVMGAITRVSAQPPADRDDDLSKPMQNLDVQQSGDDAQSKSMTPGQRCEHDIVLVPWKLVTNYPTLYVPDVDREEVRAYFTTNLQRNRAWDFYFMLQPGSTSRDTLLLVPLPQLQSFLGAASTELGSFRILSQIRQDRMLDTATMSPDWPRPRFLGRVKNAQALKPAIKLVQEYPADNYDHLTIEAYKAYKWKMEILHNAGKGSSGKENLAMLRMEKLEKQKRNGRVVKRVQRYLGLRGSHSHVDGSGASTTAWTPDMVAPFHPKDNVRFVCIDVEAFEFNTKLLTEFGFAVLDTEDISGIAPGENGSNWISAVKGHHFIINEYSHLKNKRFVKGCPEKFNFGRSGFAWLRDMPKIAARIFGDPDASNVRPLVLVGHDIVGDLRYLRQIGYNVWNTGHVIDEVDTQVMFRRLQRSPNGRSLITACEAVNIETKDLHNAGNDAWYTLAAMIAMAVKQRAQPCQSLKPWQMVEEAEWSDGELDDGGIGQRSAEPVEKAQEPANQDNQRPQKKKSPW